MFNRNHFSVVKSAAVDQACCRKHFENNCFLPVLSTGFPNLPSVMRPIYHLSFSLANLMREKSDDNTVGL